MSSVETRQASRGPAVLLCALALIAFVIAGASCAERHVQPPKQSPPTPDGGASVSATPAPAALPDEPTLDDYLAYAGQNSPALRAARERWQAAIQRISQERALPDPMLSYNRDVQGPEEWEVMLSQTFPWFGTLRLRGDVALQEALMAQQEYEAARLDTVYRFKQEYFDYYYLAHSIAVTEENIQLVTSLEEVARQEYTGGRAPQSAVIKAQIELEKLRDSLRELTEQRTPAAAKLNAILGRDPGASLPWPKDLPDDSKPASADELIGQLRAGNPELKSLDFAIANAVRSVSLAGRSRYPDLTLGVKYMSNDSSMTTGGADSDENPVMVMLSINLPVWVGKNRAAIREARATLESAIAERADRENMLLAELKMALFMYEDAGRKITLYKDTLVPQAEQSLKVTQQAFTAGSADFLDLIDAQRTLLDIRLMAERALANRAQRRAEIDMLVGAQPASGPPPASGASPAPGERNAGPGNQPGAGGVHSERD